MEQKVIILAVLKTKHREGKRRAAGRQVTEQLAIGIDKYNYIIAKSTDSIFAGKKFAGKFEHLFPCLKDFDVDEEFARQCLISALEHALKISLDKNLSIPEIDKKVKSSKITSNSSGELQMYRNLKEKWAKNKEPDQGDIILWSAKK